MAKFSKAENLIFRKGALISVQHFLIFSIFQKYGLLKYSNCTSKNKKYFVVVVIFYFLYPIKLPSQRIQAFGSTTKGRRDIK
jgi:hypothetical protein